MKHILDDAIAAARRRQRCAPPARLAISSRDRILNAALEGGPAPHPFARLFVPLRRLSAAAIAPVALAALLIMGLPQEAVQQGATTTFPAIQATKRGNQVMFTIANGTGTHRVTRSTTPDRFDRGQSVEVRDAYTDRIDHASSLVFYRID